MTAVAVAAARPEAAVACRHCGLPAPQGTRFCCPGCAAAHDMIEALGLGRYYRDRVLDPASRPPKPALGDRPDLVRYCTNLRGDLWDVTLALEGLQCGACVWLIESALAMEPDVTACRINMGTGRLRLAWHGEAARAEALAGRIEALGYRVVPFEPQAIAAARDEAGRALLRCLAVAGFAAGNVMLLALATWVGPSQGMGPATRALLHWMAALIALPAVAYAGRPFFASAFAALRHGRTNMDVPVSLGVVLVSALSVWQCAAGGQATYFESATMLLFFLLLGRLLDHRARSQASSAAERLLALRAVDAAMMMPDGSVVRRPAHALAPGDLVLVAMGERLAADGAVEAGYSELDTSLVTGESLPEKVSPGSRVFAGTINLGPPLRVRVTATGTGTVLAECVRLIEAAEAGRSRIVILTDRIARLYAPAVHLGALATLAAWLFAGASLAQSVLAASAVLIITCPCALALAVPAVQLIATGRLFAAGTLLKSPTALERLAQVTDVCFDKTGTLTEPTLMLDPRSASDPASLRAAAGIAAASRHPLARALCAAAGPVELAAGATECPGEGIRHGAARLGSAAFCGLAPGDGTELCFVRPGRPTVRFRFHEQYRADAPTTLARLRDMGLRIHVLSGDRPAAVANAARVLGIESHAAAQRPADKAAAISSWQERGARVLMVGDGLNDSPSLATAHVSAAPANAADISQTVADFVYQGSKLAPVAIALATARRARAIIRQNLALALIYNTLMVPLAMAGYVTPWLAAAAMSGSSVAVVLNSLRAREVPP